MKRFIILCILQLSVASIFALGKFGDWTCSVAPTGYISDETGKAPNAFLWIPNGCEHVNFAVLAQQNMTEEALLRSPRFRKKMKELGGALIWVAPWFSQNWDPQTGCQQTFEEMMVGLAGQSGHPELATVPIVPFGHSAQATFPWNFAAWNPDRTLCIISFHGDAPRTNLCGYGTANVEWGRTRNIDGIPGLMIEGEYEWWEARLNPARAFRIMYPTTRRLEVDHVEHALQRELVEVQAITHIIVGRYCLRVVVDHDTLVTQFTSRVDGVYRTPVELYARTNTVST